jgi:hypothetical protein
MQRARLTKAWLLVRQQQRLVCKHLQQQSELQVRALFQSIIGDDKHE